jgi:hypothetical protein
LFKDIKDMEQNSPQQGHSRVLLDGSAFAAFFTEKVQKIAHALYLVTSYVPSDEPIRAALRASAIEMVSSLHGSDLKGGASVLGGTFSPLFGAISSYLSIAKNAGYISDMNADVLLGEIRSLQEMMTGGEDSQSGLLLSTDFFSVPMSSSRHLPQAPSPRAERFTPAPQKDIVESNGHSSNGRKEKKSKSTRRDKILSLFKDKKRITINDVEKIIEGCSKKTMQRELLSLVEEGVLSKEGEKRWSVYTLSRPLSSTS